MKPFVKIVMPGSYGWDEPMSSLVDVHSHGIDKSWLVKRAAAGVFRDMDIKARPGHSIIHLIALGDGEFYGANRNGDWFGKTACTIELPEPKTGVDKLLKVACGNVERHYTFEKCAKVYRNHSNKNPNNSHGDVVKSAHNDTMNRVELLIDVDDKGWSGELEKLAKGEDLDFSMACTTNPDYPVLTDLGYRAISSIVVGDIVHTHAGNWKRVKAVNRRLFTGQVFEFEFNGLPLPLELTSDHLLMAKVFSGSRKTAAMASKYQRYFSDQAAFENESAGWTHVQHMQIGDRVLYRRVGRVQGYGAIDSVELATIMGYYLAEGSFSYNGERACTTQFTCHMDDSLPRRLPKLVAAMYPEITVSIRPHHASEVGLTVDVSHTGFSEFLRKYVGRHADKKTICPELFNANDACKLSFLGAWCDGDGFVDVKGVHWSSCSLNLLLQGRDLLASIGISASIYRIDHAKCATSGYPGSGMEYTLNVSHIDAHALEPYSEKVMSRPPGWLPERTHASALRPCPDGGYAYRISGISSRAVSEVQTYNIEVEDDESYTLAGLISHNCRVPYDYCSVCGNKAASRSQYCRHLLDHMTEFTKSGHQIAAINDHMTYFDISKVTSRADRIALGLLKAASDKVVSGSELADMFTLFPPGVAAAGAFPAEALSKLSAMEKEISGSGHLEDGDAKTLAKSFDHDAAPSVPDKDAEHLGCMRGHLDDIFGGLADAKVSLPLRDFFKILMGPRFGEVESDIPAAEEKLPGVFTRMLEKGEPVEPFGMGDDALPASVREIIQKMIPAHSLEDGPVRHRIMVTIIRGKSAQPLRGEKPDTMDKSGAVSGASRLAETYARYKLAFWERAGGKENKSLTERLVLQHYVRR